MGRNLPHRTDSLLTVVQEDIETFFYLFHHLLLGLIAPDRFRPRALSTRPSRLG
jgi:hypothetical protein